MVIVTAVIGLVSAVLNLMVWPIRMLDQTVGITNQPNIVLGGLTSVALPDDPRIGYESWWHLECVNKQRGRLASRIRTRDAEDCRVELTLQPRFDPGSDVSDAGVFLLGASQPPGEIATLHVDRPMPIPLFWQVPRGTVHPIDGQRLRSGSYLTGAQFLYQPSLRDRQLLTGNTYYATVRVKWNGRTVTKQLEIQARAPFLAGAPRAPAAPPRRRSEVVSDGVRWRDTGQSYVYSGDPIPEALCPDATAAIGVMVKTPFGGEIKDIDEAYNVGRYSDTHDPYRLWCPGLDAHKEHQVTLTRSRTWDEAKRIATKKLKAQIEADHAM
jgi:hypothetical protein